MLKLDLWKLLLDLKLIASDILRYIFEPAEWIRYIAIYFNLPSEYDTWPADKPPIYLQKSFISTFQPMLCLFTASLLKWGRDSLLTLLNIVSHIKTSLLEKTSTDSNSCFLFYGIYFFSAPRDPLSLFFRFENMPITVLKDHRPDDHKRTQYLSNFLNVPQISFSHKECSLKSIDLVRGNSLSTETKVLKRKFSYRRRSCEGQLLFSWTWQNN